MSNLWVHNASAEVNAASQYPEILGACISLTAIMIVAIGLRGYVRGYMLKMMGWDDWVIIFSGVGFSVSTVQSLECAANYMASCVPLFTVAWRLAVSCFSR